MDYSIRLMKDDEIAFAYTQRKDIMQESGCIGHLRVDMDSTGTGFFTSWDNHTAELKTDAFKAEFDEVINELRFGEESGGFLKNRDSIKKFVRQFPGSSITEDNIAFGLRVDTDDHAYMVRMNPQKGEYAAYIYAYNREMLDAYLEPVQEQAVEQEGPITVLVVEPGKTPYVKEIDSGLVSLQSEVGGWIEAVYPFEDPVAIVCNEEGKLEGFGTSNMSAYIRKMAIDGYIVKLELPELKEMTRLLANYSNNLNQIAKRVNATGEMYSMDLTEIQQHQEDLWLAAEKIIRTLAKFN